MQTSKEFIIGKETPWEDAAPGVKRQLFGYDGKIMMVKIDFSAGAIGAAHEHHHSQVTYVESGVFEMTIGEETRTIRAGDGYYVPPHIMHGVVCTEAGILVDVFSPLREDFL